MKGKYIRFIERSILFTIIAIIQILFVFEHPVEWYKKFFEVLTVLDIGIIVISVYFVSRAVKEKNISYMCVLIDCIGVMTAIFTCQENMKGFTGEFKRSFIMMPYIIFFFISSMFWIATRKNSKVFFMNSEVKNNIVKIVKWILYIFSFLFFSLALYFGFVLNNNILCAWSVFTGILTTGTGILLKKELQK